MLLAGDIGGTKTDLAIFSNEAGPHAPLVQTEVHSADYPSLQALANEFLTKAALPVDRACFAVAGPVINGRAKTTNLPWVMDEVSLAKELNLSSVHLMNDLEAIAEAIPILREGDVRTLNAGRPVPKGAIGVIAPGTGLGESFLTWDGSRYVARGSEGGHADFAPTEERHIGLLRRMLYGVTPLDGVTIGGVIAMILTVSAVAVSWPAWRAARVDPVTALRAE